MSFKVYTASAGSGKTFTMVKDMLAYLLFSNNPYAVSRIWAVTFTNKAANEMKERLLKELETIAAGKPSPMLDEILKIKPAYEKEIRKKAAERLEEILFHYDRLSISTIDKFSFRIIRQFARELGIAPGINVDLDDMNTADQITDEFLRELTPQSPFLNSLRDMVLENIEDAKKWRVADELKKFKYYLLPDHYWQYTQTLHQINPREIISLRGKLFREIKELQKNMAAGAEEIKRILLPLEKDINRFNDKIKVIEKLIAKDEKVIFQKTILSFLTGKNLWKKNKELPEAEESIADHAQKIFKNYVRLLYIRAARKTLGPLMLMKEMHRRLEAYKKENDMIFISDFNKIIQNVVADSPTPFIYWRLGERYEKYFIDEFQDTSHIQWNNMIPLISEAFSGNFPDGSAGIFGDAKQSIYRFRGGEPEQFIELSTAENTPGANPFATSKSIHTLDANWRSAPEIVEFNNYLFPHLAQKIDDPFYSLPYSSGYLKQTPRKNYPGYIRLDFEEVENEEAYLEKITRLVEEILAKSNYKPGDITILFHKGKEGNQISEALTNKGFSVVSADSLMLESAKELEFLNKLFAYRLHPQDDILFELLLAFAAWKGIQPTSDFFTSKQGMSLSGLIESLSGKKINEKLISGNIYDFFVGLIEHFGMNQTGENAYIRAFLDQTAQHLTNTLSDESFIELWKNKIGKKSVSSLESPDAIRLMTVHKAKGLEFPVVIYAYPQNKFIDQNDLKKIVWIQTNETLGIPFLPFTLNDLNKLVKLKEHTTGYFSFPSYLNNLIEKAEKEKSKILFEKTNLQYVAFTRPIERLYYLPFIKKETQESFVSEIKTIASQYENISSGKENIFEIGTPVPSSQEKISSPEEEFIPGQDIYRMQTFDSPLIHINREKLEFWSESRREKISYGLMIHRYLSQLHTREDLEYVKARVLAENDPGRAEEMIKIMENLLGHPGLKNFFSKERYNIITERSVAFSREGNLENYRPDRILLDKKTGNIIIMDYKTGTFQKEHAGQLHLYADLLEKAGFNIQEKMLVYLHPSIQIKKV